MIKIITILIFFLTLNSCASCKCVCVDGKVQAECSNTSDAKPVCNPKICPTEIPQITPIHPPKIPPKGTMGCMKKNVYNKTTGKYEWRTICF